MRRFALLLIPTLVWLAPPTPSGENIFQITPAEIQALERAISRVGNSTYVDSQTLGDLVKLKYRLLEMQKAAAAAPSPTTAVTDDAQRSQLERLEREAAQGGRAARKSLALYYLFLGDPEKAMQQWRLMGKATEHDLSYTIISSYLDFALGEYNNGRESLETALRFLDSRVSLSLSEPIFCQNVAGYRVYTPRPPGNALPGEDVLIYVEIDGADFKKNKEGGSECNIMFGLRLWNDSQGTVWREPNYGEYAPVFSGPIRDLHAALTWRVPNSLLPGTYHLAVEALEETSHRRGESVMSFTVDKRETNVEKRPTAPPDLTPMDYRMRQEVQDLQRDAQNIFQGGGAFGRDRDSGDMWNRRDNSRSSTFLHDNPQAFEILKDYEKGQRVQ